MFPFLVNAPTIEYPLSGDVTQDISPRFFAAQHGIPEIEREVVQSVASYGDQLGALTEAVLALATAAGVEGDAIAEVERIAAEVADAKARVTKGLRARAEMVLKRLEKVDPEGFRKVTGKQGG